MRHIASIPRLRMLMGQGAIASDKGFAALSRSQTLEYFWGRDAPELRRAPDSPPSPKCPPCAVLPSA